jgi:hypothetical protein
LLNELTSLLVELIEEKCKLHLRTWQDVVNKMKQEERWAVRTLRKRYPYELTNETAPVIRANAGRMPVHFHLLGALDDIGMSPDDLLVCKVYKKIRNDLVHRTTATQAIEQTMLQFIESHRAKNTDAQALSRAAEAVNSSRP